MSDVVTAPVSAGQDRLPGTIDIHVGSRVRLRRMLLGMSQEKLGAALNLTFQQIQKYERGVNRIGASRLFDLARILDVPIGFFFDDIPPSLQGRPVVNGFQNAGYDEPYNGVDDGVLHKRETLELVRAYHQISEPEIRKRVLDLIRSLASAE
ncbi:helix-turn-helix domain-containing protein [Roseomonas sp. WA12]